MSIRENPDLDDAMLGTESGSAKLDREIGRVKAKRGRRRQGKVINQDMARRYAFKVLACIAGLDLRCRSKVLNVAVRLNKS